MKTTNLFFLACAVNLLLCLSGCDSKQNKSVLDPVFRHVCENRFIILTDSADVDLQRGDPERASSIDGCALALADIHLDKTPAKYKAMIGQEFDIYDGFNQKITVKVKSLKLMVRYIPHFGQELNWSGEYSGTNMSAKEIANDIWNSDRPVMVAEFELQSPRKIEFKLSVPHSSVDITQFKPQDTNSQKRVQEIEKLLSTHNIWWNESIGQQGIETFKINDELTFYSVNRTIGDICGGQGEFKASYFLIKAENNKLSLVTEIEDDLNTVGVIDINNDQKIEFLVRTLGKNYLLHQVKNKWTLDKPYIVNYFDCPC